MIGRIRPIEARRLRVCNTFVLPIALSLGGLGFSLAAMNASGFLPVMNWALAEAIAPEAPPLGNDSENWVLPSAALLRSLLPLGPSFRVHTTMDEDPLMIQTASPAARVP